MKRPPQAGDQVAVNQSYWMNNDLDLHKLDPSLTYTIETVEHLPYADGYLVTLFGVQGEWFYSRFHPK